MSGDKSSLSTEVQHDEHSQTSSTQTNNQDIKNENLVGTNDKQDKSSTSSNVHEPHQATTLDGNKNDNATTPEFEAITNESAKASANPILDPSTNSATTIISPSNENNLSPLDAATTITRNQDSDVNKKANVVATDDPPKTSNQDSKIVDQINPPTTDKETNEANNPQILDSNDNKKDTDESPKISTPAGPSSNQDSKSGDQTELQVADTKQATNQSTQTNTQDDKKTPSIDQAEANQANNPQILDSNDNKQDTDESSKISTPTGPSSNQDAKSGDQADEQVADTKQATNQSTQTNTQDDKKTPSIDQAETNQDNNPQILDSNENKQATDESPKTSDPTGPSASQDSKPGDQTDLQVADTKQDTDQSTQTNAKDDKKIPSIDRAEDNRKHLQTMIEQELKIVEDHCPRLGEHEQRIRKEAEEAKQRYQKLKNENCDLNDLKFLRKTVTKLKLQIPARYMTYDENDKQNKKKSVEDRKIRKLEKIIPRLHDEIFNKSPVCETIHERFNRLEPELRLCLLCFSVFPENTEISRRTMVYWWIAEGLIPEDDDTAEERANYFFNLLMDKDFIEPVSRRYERRKVAFCKMNPMVRAALIMIADDLKFFDFDKYGNPKDFGKFDEIMSPEDMPDMYPLGEPREFFDFFDANGGNISNPIDFVDSHGNRRQFAAHYLHKQSQTLIDRNGKPIDTKKTYYLYYKKEITTNSYKVCLMASGLSKGIPWENLHMLFNVQDNVLEFKQEWLSRMKNINILFLGKWQSSVSHHIEVEEFEFEKSLDYMNHVRFFSLQGVSRITKLPYSISKLKSLVILDLRACHNLEEIPGTIGLLKCLTHLDMSECYLLRKIPKEISLLKSLQVLKGFVVVEYTEKEACTLQDLKKLENLKKLSMYTHMKNFPEVSHLDAIEKLVTLRKLTILWGGNQPETSTTKDDVGNNKKQHNLTTYSKFWGNILYKKRVDQSLRRMNAFTNSPWGSRLEKLDLKCFPHSYSPTWLTAGNFKGLKKLYIRGGNFSNLGQYDNHFQWVDSPVLPKETWTVEILRLKYLEELNMEWRELHNLFPKLTSLEKVKCPRLTLFPCNEKGIWTKKGSPTTR